MKTKLFQYWDDPVPPAEVAEWLAGFGADNPDLEHVVFDASTAAAFIARHYGPRELAAFQACAVPAMQADVIRLCALNVFGGIYIDADHQSLQPLSGLLADVPRSLIFEWLGLLNNAVLVFPAPADPFIRACLNLTISNVEARRFNSAFGATGPGVFNAVRTLVVPSAEGEIMAALEGPDGNDWEFRELLKQARLTVDPTPELTAAYQDMTLMNPIAASLHIGLAQPAYKETDRHWLRWKGSIYRDR